MSAALSKGLISTILGQAVSSTPEAGPLVNAKMGLFSNGIAITPDTVLSDLTESTWTGYAKGTINPWAGPLLDANLNEVVRSPLINFACTSNTGNEHVVGWFIVDTGATTLYAAATLDTPITPVAGQSIGIVAELGISGLTS